MPLTPEQERWWKSQRASLEIYDNWQDMPWSTQRWPNFSPWEFYSKGDGELALDEAALDCLQMLRTRLNKPVQINSAYRSISYNKLIGGAKRSMHPLGIAFDISLHGHNRERVERIARECGFTGIGRYKTFIHIDTRPWRATWGRW